MIDRWGCMILGGLVGGLLGVVRMKATKNTHPDSSLVPTPLGYDQHTNTFNSKAPNVGAGLGYLATIPSGA